MTLVPKEDWLDKTRWVPRDQGDWHKQVVALARALDRQRICLLTGAGCSTESGIPDYRGEGTARRARNPILLRQFLASHEGRCRYWARSMLGWPRFRSAFPNRAHFATASLERAGVLSGVITQNVDRLHHRAGASSVVELHGALEEVRCLSCGHLEARDDLQARLVSLNPDSPLGEVELNPDGDAELPEDWVAGFRVADCMLCGGILKPNVVFFGEGVPRSTVEQALRALDAADALLVVGSSLTVFSGYRFVRKAAERKMPISVINIGPTRADPLAALKIAGPAGEALTALSQLLLSGQGADGALETS